MKILSLEDDPAQAELIQTILRSEGYDVYTFREGSKAIRYLENATADLLVLDWRVPDMSGLDVLRWVRERIGKDLPVLFLTSYVREDETVVALNAGADDYMVKPVRRRELIARINALLRRTHAQVRGCETRIEIGKYVIDLHNRIVMLEQQVMDLTPKEFEITAILFRNIGRVMPREMLVKVIWGRNLDKISRSLDTHIYRLKHKLRISSGNGIRLRAIYTHGYRLELIANEEIDGAK